MTAASFNTEGRANTGDTLQQRIDALQAHLSACLVRAKAPRLFLGVENSKAVLHMTVHDPATNEFTQYTADFIPAASFVGAKAGDDTLYLCLRGSNRYLNFTELSPHAGSYLAGRIDAELSQYEAGRGKPRYKPFVPPEFSPMGGS